MNTISLGVDWLYISWLIAAFISGLSVLILQKTSLFVSIVHLMEKRVQNQFIHRNANRITFITFMALFSLLISQILSPEIFNVDSFEDLSTVLNLESGAAFNKVFGNDLVAFAVLLALIASIPILNLLHTRLQKKIENWRQTRFRLIKFQHLEILTPNRLADLLVLLSNYGRTAVLLLVFIFAGTLVLSVFPITQDLAQMLISEFVQVLNQLWEQILVLIPNLITLFIIAVFTRMALKILRFFHEGLKQGRVRVHGIHPELIDPTYQLLRFLVVAFALVAAFPYIPGSSSPVFRGLSIFVGFLVSLGSTSLITNIVSGIVLTYSRGLRIGDRVQIGKTRGDVVDRTILVTRVRSIKNVVITIPNSIVMQNEIINYSAEARDRGLVLHTSVTIGYDAPWRKVEKLLTESALNTRHILRNPKPFVLKTNLNDHYITYELNAYTSNASVMENIYSELHQNILDYFNSSGVEIMSPAYFAFRDGQDSTIPQVESSNRIPSGPTTNQYFGERKQSRQYREETQPLG